MMDIPYSVIAPFEPLGIPELERRLTLMELSELLANCNDYKIEYTDDKLVIIIPHDSPYAKYIK